jgi:quinol monooxygenase YgiN
MSKGLTLIARFTARVGKISRVEQSVRDYAGRVRSEPGNREFSIYRDESQPRQFVVVERYADSNAVKAHLLGAHRALFNAALEPLIEEPVPQLSFLAEVDHDRRC